MYCLNCGVQLPAESNFCKSCGNPVAVDFDSQTVHARRVMPLAGEKTKQSNSLEMRIAGFIVTLIIAVVVVGGAVFLFVAFQDDQKREKDREATKRSFENAGMTNTTSPTPLTKKAKVKKSVEQSPDEIVYQNTNSDAPITSQPQTVVNDTFAVNAATIHYYNFSLNSLSRVIGRFEASGGRNDIDAIILDADEFTNYRNTGNYKSYFHSGYITVGNIDLNLPAGSYYIIFSNSAALFTNKIVKAKIEIQ